MKVIKTLIVLGIILKLCIFTNAQTDVLERIKGIKIMSSMRQDVEKAFGKSNDPLPLSAGDREISAWYINDNESLEFTYSNGKCIDGWNAPKNTVIGIYVRFKNERKLSDLQKKLKREKISLNKLRKEIGLDVEGETYFYDDRNGIKYGVDMSEKIWFSITYYPSSKYSKYRCED
jgi:hypothetical protein